MYYDLKPCPFCGGDAEMTSTWNNRYRKYFINVRCTVCGSCSKGYTSDENPTKNDWDLDACYNAAAIWNKRPYLNDDIRVLAERLGEYILSKSHTEEVSEDTTQGEEVR